MKKWMDWRHIPLLIFSAFAIGPIILLVSNALKPKEEFRDNPLQFPSRLEFNNITEAWEKGGYAAAFLNSTIVGISCIVIICFSAGLAAYALAKLRFRGMDVVMGALLFILSIPMGLFLVPLFFMWQQLNLMDSLIGIIIIYSAIFLPFNIFMLRSFFVAIPNELIDSAKVDGCTEFQVITKILAPLASPAFLTVVLIVALWTWNEFFFANAFLQSNEIKTVATKFLAFTGQYTSDWSMISAAGLITILPIAIIFLVLQRRFIEGIAEGSIKG
ncbi:ABC transporter permease subunit [Gracilibacillus salitolerans]|uniref:ABC transporter permease subunit n=1 Tax=Gracilibacillus salitolerans TaxID=2663022 RepID=A0A5Q2TQ28_9BACI|nr:carbohydrate ABC transporter permease [Gracilibacillus salitolerans]QGH36242.1 ABC transporter permease subunit [Gracilibacillus salitolerans]